MRQACPDCGSYFDFADRGCPKPGCGYVPPCWTRISDANAARGLAGVADARRALAEARVRKSQPAEDMGHTVMDGRPVVETDTGRLL